MGDPIDAVAAYGTPLTFVSEEAHREFLWAMIDAANDRAKRSEAKVDQRDQELDCTVARWLDLRVALEAERETADQLRAALVAIANGRQCTSVVESAPPSAWCRNTHRTIDAKFGADRWCDACIANDALEAVGDR